MIKRVTTNCGDDTCPSCVIAGDYIFLAHHSAGQDKDCIEYQMESTLKYLQSTLESVGASLDDMVQINLYLKSTDDLRKARDVFYKFFKNGFPARMTTTSEFISKKCLCMVDGVAYKKQS